MTARFPPAAGERIAINGRSRSGSCALPPPPTHLLVQGAQARPQPVGIGMRKLSVDCGMRASPNRDGARQERPPRARKFQPSAAPVIGVDRHLHQAAGAAAASVPP
jgi:hypothetical protein